MQIVNCLIVNFIHSTREKTYGGVEIGDEPKFALMVSDDPRTITKRTTIKPTYRRNISDLLLLTFISIN